MTYSTEQRGRGTLGTLLRNTTIAVMMGATTIFGGCKSSEKRSDVVPPPIKYDNSKANVTDEDIETMLNSTGRIGVTLTYQKQLPADGSGEQKYSIRQIETGGSMLHIANENGHAYYLTSNHIVDAPETFGFFWETYKFAKAEIYIEEGKKKIPLEVLANEKEADLALLRTKGKHKPDTKPYNHFALDSKVKVGDQVYTVGFPYVIGKQLSVGIVRSKVTSEDYKDEEMFKEIYWISAHLNPGNSGGPTFVVENGKPRVLGIGKLLLDSKGGGIYAIVKIDAVKRFLDKHKYGRFYIDANKIKAKKEAEAKKKKQKELQEIRKEQPKDGIENFVEEYMGK